MKITDKTDFFKRKGGIRNEEPTEEMNDMQEKLTDDGKSDSGTELSTEFTERIGSISGALSELGLDKTAKRVNAVCEQAKRSRFSVAVVGEFSTGKSTFVNAMIGRSVLPVANLPTTALMTRIRYNEKEVMAVVDGKGNKVKTLPLTEASWDGLTADNFGGNDPSGCVYVGVNDAWFGSNSVEIIDTPGAGDLEESRVKVVGEALKGCDGAIITVSALAAMSISEKLFIEQRLKARRTPFLMLVITKLDQIEKEERAEIIDFVKQKLSDWELPIPVYVPYDVEITGAEHSDCVGMDKVKAQICAWINDPERAALTEAWLYAKVADAIQPEITALKDQLIISKASDDKRKALIEKKEELILKAQNIWGEIRLGITERKSECYAFFKEKAEEGKRALVERLQYEASKTNQPERWWNEDYPYRLKIELSNLAASIENAVTKKISDDVKWLNANLDHSFKTSVLCEVDKIVDKDTARNASAQEVQFEDLGKQRNAVRIGTAVASIALSLVCASFGVLPLVATLGVSTGASIVSDKVFSGKIEKQRQGLKQLIATGVPNAIDEATVDSEERINAVYDELCASADTKEQEWLGVQRAAALKSAGEDDGRTEKLEARIAKISALIENI